MSHSILIIILLYISKPILLNLHPPPWKVEVILLRNVGKLFSFFLYFFWWKKFSINSHHFSPLCPCNTHIQLHKYWHHFCHFLSIVCLSVVSVSSVYWVPPFIMISPVILLMIIKFNAISSRNSYFYSNRGQQQHTRSPSFY